MRVTFHETEKDTETHRESHVQTEPVKLLPVKGCWETPEAARSKALEPLSEGSPEDTLVLDLKR